MRIKGQFGPWPVDLQIELDAAEWTRLGGVLSGWGVNSEPAAEPVSPAAPALRPEEPLWAAACELLRQSGALEGPQLLADLQALAGGAAAGKRLMVRLRHCPQVQLHTQGGTLVYRWQDDQAP